MLGSNSSTWKGGPRTRSEDRDRPEKLNAAGQEEGGPGELIEWDYGYSYVLMVPGGRGADVAVEVTADRLKAGSLGFVVERKFPRRVDPSTATSTCVNGVLCIRVSKVL